MSFPLFGVMTVLGQFRLYKNKILTRMAKNAKVQEKKISKTGPLLKKTGRKKVRFLIVDCRAFKPSSC